jgi:BirA family biotin operon repressor/biotin-[acetyl-CoA-carboxylase] ligase
MPADSGLFNILASVDSTNNYAMGQIHSGNAAHGDAWFAVEQTKGKGRRGKAWEADKGKNIMLSIVADVSFLQLYEQFQLSAAVALGCYDFYKIFDNIHTKIKWPNDLFWNDKKAGGVLIENVINGNIWQWTVIGIGININQTNFLVEENEPVSLKQITGQTYDVIALGKQLHESVIKRLEELRKNGFEEILLEYNSFLYKRNEKTKLKKENVVVETTITGVSKLGQLQTFDTIERSFDFDEVKWIL